MNHYFGNDPELGCGLMLLIMGAAIMVIVAIWVFMVFGDLVQHGLGLT